MPLDGDCLSCLTYERQHHGKPTGAQPHIRGLFFISMEASAHGAMVMFHVEVIMIRLDAETSHRYGFAIDAAVLESASTGPSSVSGLSRAIPAALTASTAG